MATASDVIYTRLSAVSAVTDIVGSGDNARIWPISRREGAANPSITYQRISAPKESAMGTADTGLTHPLFQVDCFADTYREVDDLAEAVRGALQRYSGTVCSVVVQVIELVNTTDTTEDASREHRITHTFRISHLEA